MIGLAVASAPLNLASRRDPGVSKSRNGQTLARPAGPACARRRRPRGLSQARLDVTAWRRQRYLLASRASLPPAPLQEQCARLRLLDLLTGTHPRDRPEPLRLPGRSQNYDELVFTMPEQMAFCVHQQARSLLSRASISEPVTWEPPPGWVTGIPRCPRPSRTHPALTSSATSPARDTAPARSPASPDAASAPSGSSSPAPGSAS